MPLLIPLYKGSYPYAAHQPAVRLGYQRDGLGGVRDAQIAAVAASRDLVLVTRNVEDFKAFNGLKIQNWFD